MTLAVTIKMISKTRTTSTSGTTFISDRTPTCERHRPRPIRPPLDPIPENAISNS